jgi:hypothetical protein
MPRPLGRSEKRTAVEVAVVLSGPGSDSGTALALTENLSQRGARIRTKRQWHVGETLSIRSLDGTLRAQARVIYSQALSEREFALGAELMLPADDWRIPRF